MDRKIYIIVFVLLFYFAITPRIAHAEISNWQKGFTIRLNNQTTAQVDIALNEMKKAGIDYVAISPGWITSSNTSSNVDRKVGTSPDILVTYTINKSHSLGMRVLLKPHLDISGGEWRAALDPTDKTKFFQNYSKMILMYANMAQQTNVEEFSVGAELVKLSTNPNNTNAWKDLVTKVRAVYSGKLTYSANADTSANLDEVGRLTFWQTLDYVGMSFYRPLSDDNNPTVDSIKAQWQDYENNYIIPRYNQIQKPMFFSEIGYRSINGAATHPWDYTVSNNVDTQEQKDLYTAFFDYWKDKDYIKGVNFWEWDAGLNINPKTNKSYTPQLKPAQEVVANYFQGTNTPETPISTEDGSLIKHLNQYTRDTIDTGTTLYPDRSYTVTNIPDGLRDNEYIVPKNIDKSVTTHSDFLTFDLAQQLYIYVAYDQRAAAIPAWLNDFKKTGFTIKTSDAVFNIYQKRFDAGSVSLGGNLASPARNTNSNYFVIVSINGLVDESILPEVPVPEIPPVVPTLPPITGSEPNVIGKITVENPDDNDEMDGEKKMKIYINGTPLSNYTATYNVDNKGSVDMPDDSTVKYKQSKIDFEKWNWNGNGPYNVVIEARDLLGNIIDTTNLTLFVAD